MRFRTRARIIRSGFGATWAAISPPRNAERRLWRVAASLGAKRANLGLLQRAESEVSRLADPGSTLHKWRRALEAAGVMFIDPDEKDGPGVRLRGTKGKRG
jgi:hypothetical protein